MSKLASQSARTALKNFIQKDQPTNIPPPAKEGNLEQALPLSQLKGQLGEFEEFPFLPRRVTVTKENILGIEEPYIDILEEFDLFLSFYSKRRPLSLDNPCVEVFTCLCDTSQLESLTEGMDTEWKRNCFLKAGYYEYAKTIDGWDEFADQAYLSTDNDSRDMGLTNGDAYGLCRRMQEMGIVGNTPAMVGVYHTIAQLARMSCQGQSPIVRIEGKHGSGKGAIAKALHDIGGRTGKFRRMNISAHSDELILSELYGHGKGAFTGAKQNRVGWFEICKNGTLVLDDLNHMNPDHQSKLLHALEERKISKIGDDTPINVSDTMVIVTSNEDLAQKDAFQSDLLERISTHVLKIPELLVRVSDVANLTRHFMDQQPLSNEISPFRFQIAWKLRKWAQEGILTVRALRNEIENLARESQSDFSAIIENRDPFEQKILAVIEELYPNGEKPVKAKVAAKLGIGASTLSDIETRYGKAWRKLEEEGKITGWPSEKPSDSKGLSECTT